MNDHRNISKDDPLKRIVEKNSGEELSPFDPPDAYDPPNLETVPYYKLDPFLQELVDEHKAFTDVLNDFESALLKWRENNWQFDKEIDGKFKNFFNFIDEKVPAHNQKEEKDLFPLLNKKLIDIGEHNPKDSSLTGIKIMEDEHIKVAQAAAIVFNFLGLGSRLPDQRSREITFQSAFEQGIAIIETMRLHIFREENILFKQAMKLFDKEEFVLLKK
ncbi:MAG: hemerythrin domain-containing protein [Melioribacteraceae bacterium]|nr:hemerythrin domain-containing protein [Melioribacteraceae bacterium]